LQVNRLQHNCLFLNGIAMYIVFLLTNSANLVPIGPTGMCLSS
jgi:hypothetical protein